MNYILTDNEPRYGRMAPHNLASYMNLREAFRKNGYTSLSRSYLEFMLRDHKSGDKRKPDPGHFIDYCERCGWIEQVSEYYDAD